MFAMELNLDFHTGKHSRYVYQLVCQWEKCKSLDNVVGNLGYYNNERLDESLVWH